MFYTVKNCVNDYISKTYNLQDFWFKARKMNESIGEKTAEYAVYGNIYYNENKYDAYFKVKLDLSNMTYEAERVENCNSIEEIEFIKNDTSIEKNETNNFEYNRLTDENLCRTYYEDFCKLEIYDPQDAYSMIDEKYKEIRFPTINDYMEYLNENQNIIKTGELAKYSCNYKDEYTECTIVDTYNNSYKLQISSIVDYRIKLDNYTIKLDSYEDDYNNSSTDEKIAANAYIFIQMLNTKDYKHAYEVLDEKFRQNNFGTIDEFKKFVKNNFYEINYTDFSYDIDTQNNYYICKCVIKDSEEATQSKTLNIVMALKEGTDFVMSFNLE